jgi:hypothetical protein
MRRRPVSVVNLDHLAGIDPEEPAFRGPLRANASARRATAALVDEHGARAAPSPNRQPSSMDSPSAPQ